MVRWQPDSRNRLEESAMALYAERGFDQTTVTEIAERAGLTERTFFRYYADKREVLFGGAALLQELMVNAVASAPEGTSPIDAVTFALDAAADLLKHRPDYAKRRYDIIVASAELRERELIKLANLGLALAGALRARGVPEPAASLTAEAGITVFKVSFDAWVTGPKGQELSALMHATLESLRAATARDY